MIEQKQLVLLNGPPRSGKDYVGLHLGWPQYRFSEPLKACASSFFGLPPNDPELEERKDDINFTFHGMTYRRTQIWLSEEVMKPRFGETVFGDMLAQKIRKQKPAIAVITDSGFLMEALALKHQVPEYKLTVFRLFREGTDFNNDSRAYLYPHPREIPSHDIDNNGPITATVQTILGHLSV